MAVKTWSRTVGDANWSTAANWSGGTVPVNGDTAVFDGTSVLDCTVDALGTFDDGVSVNALYTGTITQGINVTFAAFSISSGTWTKTTQTFACAAFTVTGGTFNGGSGSMSITGTLTLQTASLTMTSGTCTISAGSFTQTGSPTFSANGGTIAFTGGTAATLTGPNCTFNLITFSKTNVAFTVAAGTTCPLGSGPTNSCGTAAFTINGTVTWTGTLTLTGGLTTASTAVITVSGTPSLSLSVSLTFHASATITSGMTVTLTGTAAQVITGTAYTFGTVTISKTGTGSVTAAASTTITLGSSPTISTWAGALVATGTITGSGTLTLAGGNNLNLSSGGTLSGFSRVKWTVGAVTFDVSATVGAFPAGLEIEFAAPSGTFGFNSGGKTTYGPLLLTGTSNGNITITESPTLTYIQDNGAGVIAHSLVFQASSTTTLSDAQPFRVKGRSGNLITVTSTTSTNAIITASAGASAVINCDYLAVDDVTVDVSPIWYAGANSSGDGTEVNWIFTAAPATIRKSVMIL